MLKVNDPSNSSLFHSPMIDAHIAWGSVSGMAPRPLTTGNSRQSIPPFVFPASSCLPTITSRDADFRLHLRLGCYFKDSVDLVIHYSSYEVWFVL